MLVTREVLRDILLAVDCQVPATSNPVYTEFLSIIEELLLEIQIRNYISLNDAEGLEELFQEHADIPLTSAGELLLEAIAAQGGCTQCPVIHESCVCSSANDGIIVVMLEDPRFDSMYLNGAPLIQAVRQNNSRVVETLLDSDEIDPAAQNNAALKLATFRGYFNIVTRLNDDVRTHYIPE